MVFDVPHQRLELIQRLSPDNPEYLTKHRISEKLQSNSPYLASLGIEVETFANRFPDIQAFIKMKLAMLKLGVQYDSHDSDPVRRNKWETVLEPTAGTHVPLMREIQALRDRELMPLPRRRNARSYDDLQDQHDSEYLPIHVTVGVKADFPTERYREDNYSSRSFFRSSDRWWQLAREFEDTVVTPEVLRLSDIYMLGRLFDATAWATSRERLLTPVITERINADSRISYLMKGFSGMTQKPSGRTMLREPVTEFRTCELWGEDSIVGLQKYLNTMQYIGAAAKSYRKIPIYFRDMLLYSETHQTKFTTHSILASINFNLPKDKDLASTWIDLRREGRAKFVMNNLPDPMTEYGPHEFTKLAYALPHSSLKRDKYIQQRGLSSQDRFARDMRNMLIRYRGIIKEIIGD